MQWPHISPSAQTQVPVKGVKVYPNNKPRVAPEIAAIRKQRQEMHKSVREYSRSEDFTEEDQRIDERK